MWTYLWSVVLHVDLFVVCFCTTRGLVCGLFFYYMWTCLLCVLVVPVDWFVAVVEMRYLLLWTDIRQGLFLSLLLCYWLVFTGEHMIDDVKRGQWTSYWKQLLTVILASSLMFIFDLCERYAYQIQCASCTLYHSHLL